MNLTREQQQLREKYVIALLEAAQPFQKDAADPELTMELLIQAAEMVRDHLQAQLNELREEQAD